MPRKINPLYGSFKPVQQPIIVQHMSCDNNNNDFLFIIVLVTEQEPMI